MTSKTYLRLSTMKGAVAHLKEIHAKSSSLAGMGVSADMFDTLTTDRVWTQYDRKKIQIGLAALNDGFSVSLGFADFPKSAEYVAAIIYLFVHDVNIQAACAWNAQIAYNGDDLAEGMASQAEHVSASQLHELVIRAKAEDWDFEAMFNAKTQKGQDRAEMDTGEKGQV